ncbi:hypothetical protein [Streptomyces cylindrosporus]|uniref:Uncharacterized protein n=1 Tax=Streptomyces cylindrosporus TaxID=2927583 RepID=A0ABS9YIC5_9ACTN|nr:hypothetical protein [Streptomyces cylindrosporus]MCI3277002.1 hypothetical protein [Streptomyces cylindrosporus]
MGYDIHITRRQDRWDEDGSEIAAHEWQAVVESDADLSMIPAPPGWSGPSQWSAVLTTHPDEERLGTALHGASGEIGAKNPSDILIAKMRQAAKALNARLQGDDGEYYDQ